MNALKYLILALQYLPHVLVAVQTVEAVVGSGDGKTKKQLVLAAVAAVAKVGEQVPESHVQVISTLTDQIVATFNQSGLFQHAATKVTVGAVAGVVAAPLGKE